MAKLKLDDIPSFSQDRTIHLKKEDCVHIDITLDGTTYHLAYDAPAIRGALMGTPVNKDVLGQIFLGLMRQRFGTKINAVH